MDSATLKINVWTAGRRKLPSDNSDLAVALAPHVEHIQQLCEQGCLAGEVVDEAFSGWWSIERSA